MIAAALALMLSAAAPAAAPAPVSQAVSGEAAVPDAPVGTAADDLIGQLAYVDAGVRHEVLATVLADADPAGPPDVPQPEPSPEPAGRYGVGEPWATLAECESGDWVDGGASFVEGSARWDWGAPSMEVPPWGNHLHHGGLQHAPSTWEWVAGDLGLLDRYPHAYDAPPAVQVQVATEVQRRQGWAAWPVCSRKVGLR